MERPPTRDCYVYIDAAYVRERLRDAGAPLEFDPRRCVTAFQNAVRVGGHDIWLTRYFSTMRLTTKTPSFPFVWSNSGDIFDAQYTTATIDLISD